MSYSLNSSTWGYRGFRVWGLNSLKGVTQGIVWGSILGVIKRDTRSAEYGSHEVPREGSVM